jgi:hypothetical protein
MRAVGEKAFEPRLGFGHRIGTSNAGDVEAALARARDECGLDLGAVC